MRPTALTSSGIAQVECECPRQNAASVLQDRFDSVQGSSETVRQAPQ